MWMPKVIHQYKENKLAFMLSNAMTLPAQNIPVVVSNENTNRLFGLVVWKLKKKYNKVIDNGNVNNIIRRHAYDFR